MSTMDNQLEVSRDLSSRSSASANSGVSLKRSGSNFKINSKGPNAFKKMASKEALMEKVAQEIKNDIKVGEDNKSSIFRQSRGQYSLVDNDNEAAPLSGEDRLSRATSGPALSTLIQITEATVNRDIRKTGTDTKTLKRVILEDEFIQRTCRELPLTILFFSVFVAFFQMHYTTSYINLQETNIRQAITDAAVPVSEIDDVYEWMNSTLLPEIWGCNNVPETGSTVSALGRQQLIAGIMVRTARGPTEQCDDELVNQFECHPGNEGLVRSKDPVLNGWTGRGRRLSEVKSEVNTKSNKKRRGWSDWLTNLFLFRGSCPDCKSSESSQDGSTRPQKGRRVIGKGSAPKRLSSSGRWRTSKPSSERKLKAILGEMKGEFPSPFADGVTYSRVLPISMTLQEAQAVVESWKEPALVTDSTLFLSVEVMLKNDNTNDGLLTHLFVNFLMSRGGGIYTEISFRTMVQKTPLKAWVVFGLWLLLMVSLTIFTPLRAFAAFKNGALVRHLSSFINIFEWIILIWGWIIVGNLALERVGMERFLTDWNDYQSARMDAEQRTIMNFDESWFRTIRENVLAFGGRDEGLIIWVANYHIILLFRFLIASRGQPRLALAVNTITEGIDDLLHLSIVFGLIFWAYVMSGHIMFGNRMEEFATWEGSLGYCLQIVFQRQYEWDKFVVEDEFTVTVWVWSFLLLVVLVVVNIVLAMIFDNYGEVRMHVTEKDTLWYTGKQLFTKVQNMSTWISNHDLAIALSKMGKEEVVNVAKLKMALPGMSDEQMSILFESAKKRLVTTVVRGNKNMLPEAIASILLGVDELRTGVRLMKDWRTACETGPWRPTQLQPEDKKRSGGKSVHFHRESDMSSPRGGGSEAGAVSADPSPATSPRVPGSSRISPRADKDGGDKKEMFRGGGKRSMQSQSSMSFEDEPPLDPFKPTAEAPFWMKSGLIGHLRAQQAQMESMYMNIAHIERALQKRGVGVDCPPIPLPQPREPVRNITHNSRLLEPVSPAHNRSSANPRFMTALDATTLEEEREPLNGKGEGGEHPQDGKGWWRW